MTITVNEAKAKAARGQAVLHKQGFQVSKAQMLEVVAALFGDDCWGAMRARLNRENQPVRPVERTRAPHRLAWHQVRLFAETEAGDREFLLESNVLCFTERQAQEFMFEEHFPGEYWNTGYAIPTYQVEVLDDMFPDCMPDLAAVCEWLALKPAAARTAVLDMLVSNGAAPVPEKIESYADVFEQAIIDASPALGDVHGVFAALYGALPPGNWYSEEDSGELYLGPDERMFKKP